MDKRPIAYVLASAFLFGVSTPLAKILLNDFSPIGLAGFLYLGAFLGLLAFQLLIKTKPGEKRGEKLGRGDIPWLAGAVLFGGVLAPISLMSGLTVTTGFAASLLLNLEGVFTALIGISVFREHGGRNLWIALGTMTVAGVLLTLEPSSGSFSIVGPLLVAFAMLCWGVDNNLTEHISKRNAVQIASIKGLIAGVTSLTIAIVFGLKVSIGIGLLLTLVLGALSYGLSLVLFIRSLRSMGSSRTSTFYSIAPFFGALVSIMILGENIHLVMIPAAVLMAVGAWILLKEKHAHPHKHARLMHTHPHQHDEDHGHSHSSSGATHEHEHVHDEVVHTHEHWPDQEHKHDHEQK